MKKHTKILSLLSSFALSASLFVNSPVTHGYFEEALEIFNSNKKLTFKQSTQLKASLHTALNNILLEINKKDEQITKLNLPNDNPMVQGVKQVREFCAAVYKYLDPGSFNAELTIDCLAKGFDAMKGFRMKLPQGMTGKLFMNLVDPTIVYFSDLYNILQNQTIKDDLVTNKDLNILRKEIKKTIANNEEIKSALKLTITSSNGNEVEYEFTTDGWSKFALGSNLTMKNLAEAICNWNEKNPNSIKNWWASRYEMTRNEIKKMVYDDSNWKWEPEDKDVIDKLFMCLDSYVK